MNDPIEYPKWALPVDRWVEEQERPTMNEIALKRIKDETSIEVLREQYFELLDRYTETVIELTALKAERRVGE